MKCRYSRCIYGGGDIEQGKEVEVSKGRYMHSECARYSNTIKEIMTFYSESIDKTVVFSELRKVINKIVFERETDPAFLLFVLKRAISNGTTIKAPYGLYYLVKDNDAIKTWSKQQAQRIIKAIPLAEPKAPQDYKYTPASPKTLLTITEGYK